MKLAPSLQDKFLELTGGRVRFGEPMRLYTTLRIGGPAEIWAEPAELKELTGLLRVAYEESLPVTVVGGGANLLVRDEGILGLVIHLTSRGFQRCERIPQGLVVSAALPLEGLVHQAQEWGLSGVEFLAGVPGRVGGAVRMNAGTHDEQGCPHSISDVLDSATVIGLDGRVETVANEALGFGYRSSRLGNWIVLEVVLHLTEADPGEVAERVRRLWAFKKRTQDWTSPSVGCIFKNPAVPSGWGAGSPSAGWLIDQAGLKGCRIGDAVISPTHANFIMNRGQATAADVLALIEKARGEVRRRFRIELELEVQVLPASPIGDEGSS